MDKKRDVQNFMTLVRKSVEAGNQLKITRFRTQTFPTTFWVILLLSMWLKNIPIKIS